VAVPAGIVGAWVAQTAIGLLGYCLSCFRSRRAGAITIAVYAALGFGGLAHSVLAPVAAHSLAMNLTIAMETAAAAVLLGVLASR
jgi:hypothetical protein